MSYEAKYRREKAILTKNLSKVREEEKDARAAFKKELQRMDNLLDHWPKAKDGSRKPSERYAKKKTAIRYDMIQAEWKLESVFPRIWCFEWKLESCDYRMQSEGERLRGIDDGAFSWEEADREMMNHLYKSITDNINTEQGLGTLSYRRDNLSMVYNETRQKDGTTSYCYPQSYLSKAEERCRITSATLQPIIEAEIKIFDILKKASEDSLYPADLKEFGPEGEFLSGSAAAFYIVNRDRGVVLPMQHFF